MAKLRRRRLGWGLLILAGFALVMMAIPMWRQHQLRASCDNGHGRWDTDKQACTFGGTAAPAAKTTHSSPTGAQ